MYNALSKRFSQLNSMYKDHTHCKNLTLLVSLGDFTNFINFHFLVWNFYHINFFFMEQSSQFLATSREKISKENHFNFREFTLTSQMQKRPWREIQMILLVYLQMGMFVNISLVNLRQLINKIIIGSFVHYVKLDCYLFNVSLEYFSKCVLKYIKDNQVNLF